MLAGPPHQPITLPTNEAALRELIAKHQAGGAHLPTGGQKTPLGGGSPVQQPGLFHIPPHEQPIEQSPGLNTPPHDFPIGQQPPSTQPILPPGLLNTPQHGATPPQVSLHEGQGQGQPPVQAQPVGGPIPYPGNSGFGGGGQMHPLTQMLGGPQGPQQQAMLNAFGGLLRG